MSPQIQRLKPQFVSIFLTLTTLCSAAFAADGPGGTGGGHLIDGQALIEYAVDDTSSDLPDFDRLEKYLKVFDDRVPDFGKKLREIASPDPDKSNSVVWYYIPRRFNDLPLANGGVSFPANQAAYQQGSEIYVSKPGISDSTLKEQDAGVPRNPGEVRAELYLNEVLEMALPSKNQNAVHKLMIYLKRSHSAPTEAGLQNMLFELGFGSYDSKSKLDHIAKLRSEMKSLVQDAEAKGESEMVSKFMTICQSRTESEDSKFDALKDGLESHDFFHNLYAQMTQEGHGLSTPMAAEVNEATTKFFAQEHVASMYVALGFSLTTSSNKDLSKKWDGYKAKYADYTKGQRVSRACDDVGAILQNQIASRPEDAGDSEEPKGLSAL